MRIVENKPLLFRVEPLRLVPNGVCVGLEIDGTTDVFFALQHDMKL